MSRARQRGMALRRKLGLCGKVDVEYVANIMELEVVTWPLNGLEEMTMRDVIGVADRLDPHWRRWVVAHAIGHKALHPGNHLWIRRNTGLVHRFEREAEDFAAGLLIDPREAREEGFRESWEVAHHFGVPAEIIQLQLPLRVE